MKIEIELGMTLEWNHQHYYHGDQRKKEELADQIQHGRERRRNEIEALGWRSSNPAKAVRNDRTQTQGESLHISYINLCQ